MEAIRNVYFNRMTADLRQLRSKKAVALQNMSGKHHTYFTQQEARKLRQQIEWIDAVLAARDPQISLW